MLENWGIVQFFKQTHTLTHTHTDTNPSPFFLSLALSLSLKLRSIRLGYSHLCTGRKTGTFSYATGHIGRLYRLRKGVTSAGRVKRERGGCTFFIHNCVLYLPALSLRDFAFVQICDALRFPTPVGGSRVVGSKKRHYIAASWHESTSVVARSVGLLIN